MSKNKANAHEHVRRFSGVNSNAVSATVNGYRAYFSRSFLCLRIPRYRPSNGLTAPLSGALVQSAVRYPLHPTEKPLLTAEFTAQNRSGKPQSRGRAPAGSAVLIPRGSLRKPVDAVVFRGKQPEKAKTARFSPRLLSHQGVSGHIEVTKAERCPAAIRPQSPDANCPRNQ